MKTTTVRLPDDVYNRLTAFIDRDPEQPSQRQILTRALIEFLDNHAADVLDERQAEIVELKRRLTELEQK